MMWTAVDSQTAFIKKIMYVFVEEDASFDCSLW
jgi:hypothetical protein